jgi:hypothetical protein
MQASTIDAMEWRLATGDWRLASGGPRALDTTAHRAAGPCDKACIVMLAPGGRHGKWPELGLGVYRFCTDGPTMLESA